jgi:cytochrome c oxidase assembly protein subunit 15
MLVAAGGMVTSTGSGLAVPDWPTTYGYNMLTFPPEKMVGGIFYEHGHRLIATAVGLLTIGAVIWLWRVEPRRWVRRLGAIALAAVVLQGILGGITVLYFLPDAVSISHAGLAEIFFALTITLALVTSPGWRLPPRPPVDDARLGRRLVWLTAVVYVQILLGATMRHTGAGLAIPDFPLVYGGLLPPAWTPHIAIHYAHRVGALVIAILAVAIVTYVMRRHSDRPELTRPAGLVALLLVAQITLGGAVVLTGKHEIVNTLHVATGAGLFVTSLALTLRAHRSRFAPATAAQAAAA